jgi:5-methylcytosine-specific restriction endonuclease McrA
MSKGDGLMRKHTLAAKKFYRTKAWKKCRLAYIAKVHGLCEHCEDPGYIVDHIIEINDKNIHDPAITLNHENLQYLCTACHNKKTFKKQDVIAEGLSFDANGDLVQK